MREQDLFAPALLLPADQQLPDVPLVRRDCEPFGLYSGMPARRVAWRSDQMVRLGDALESTQRGQPGAVSLARACEDTVPT
jgi:hypothetical protein